IALRSTYFAKVHVAKTGAINNTYKGYFQAAFRMLFPQSMLGKNNYEKIDRIFISGTEIYSRIIASYLIAYIPEIKLFYYEDGVESYSDIVGNQRHMFKGSN